MLSSQRNSNKIKTLVFFVPPVKQECLEFFNIPEARSAHYFLMDKRWNLIHYSKVGGRTAQPREAASEVCCLLPPM